MQISATLGGIRISRDLERLRDREALNLANRLLTGVRQRTPVRTGRAKSSWRRRKDGNDYTITNTQDYTVFLDQGSSRQAPRGIVKPTIRAVIGNRSVIGRKL